MLNREKRLRFYMTVKGIFFILKIEFSNLAEKYDPILNLNVQNLNKIHLILKILCLLDSKCSFIKTINKKITFGH